MAQNQGVRTEARGATLIITIDRPKVSAIDAATSRALAWELVNRVVMPDKVLESALELAQEVCPAVGRPMTPVVGPATTRRCQCAPCV